MTGNAHFGGMMVMGELHQGKVLSMTGLKVQSETLFVGNPTVGKELFSAQPGAGLVVPVRINVYGDARGQTVVSYVPPSQQLSGFGDESVDKVAKMLDDKLAQLVGMIGDLPRLMGVLLTDRFMLGPSLVSDILGYAYHFWNGASFGVIFAVLLGRRRHP